jgi:hypothetical protein
MEQIIFWVTCFAVAVIPSMSLWHIAKSLKALSRRDLTTNMHPIVLALREIKEEIKQLTAAMSVPRRCH